jgi:hypothetical protein
MRNDRIGRLGVTAALVGLALSVTLAATALVDIHVERSRASALTPLTALNDALAVRCLSDSAVPGCATLVEAIDARSRAIRTIASAAGEDARRRQRSAWRVLATAAFIGVLFVISLSCALRLVRGCAAH